MYGKKPYRSKKHVDSRLSRPLIFAGTIAYAAVMVSLTTLRAFYSIGYLWNPENQRVRDVLPIPFEMLWRSTTWFGPIFDYFGNIAFFIPMGMLLFVALYRSSRPLLRATLVGLCLSMGIEITQYIFRLGYTSLDDLWCNTLGAFIGAWLAKVCGPQRHKVWVWLAIALAVVFAVLVGLGERLGDPEKVVELENS